MIVLFRRTRSRERSFSYITRNVPRADIGSLKIFTTSHFSVTSCFSWYKWACLVDLFFSLFKKIPTGSWSHNICLTISFLRNEKDYWGAATHSTGSIVTALICIFELGLTTASLNITLTTYRWHILQRFKNFKQFKCILELGHTTMTDRQCHTKDSKRTRFGLTSDQYQTLIVLHPTVEFTGLCNIGFFLVQFQHRVYRDCLCDVRSSM